MFFAGKRYEFNMNSAYSSNQIFKSIRVKFPRNINENNTQLCIIHIWIRHVVDNIFSNLTEVSRYLGFSYLAL